MGSDLRASGPIVHSVRGFVQGLMGCCTANGERALYDAWRNVVHSQGEEVKVNLLLNHAHKAVDVDSRIP